MNYDIIIKDILFSIEEKSNIINESIVIENKFNLADDIFNDIVKEIDDKMLVSGLDIFTDDNDKCIGFKHAKPLKLTDKGRKILKL